MNHTPGPWSVADEAPIRIVKDFGPTGTHVCTINGLTPDAVADARLIAAAPELLEALKAMLVVIDINDITHRHIDKAEAAIAKAEGK